MERECCKRPKSLQRGLNLLLMVKVSNSFSSLALVLKHIAGSFQAHAGAGPETWYGFPGKFLYYTSLVYH